MQESIERQNLRIEDTTFEEGFIVYSSPEIFGPILQVHYFVCIFKVHWVFNINYDNNTKANTVCGWNYFEIWNTNLIIYSLHIIYTLSSEENETWYEVWKPRRNMIL